MTFFNDNFVCLSCDFKCSYESDYKRHIKTKKHKILSFSNESLEKTSKNEFICSCGKKYKHSPSLSHHKKTCLHNKKNHENVIIKNDKNVIIKNNNEKNEIINDVLKEKEEIIMKLLKDKEEMMQLMKEMIPKIGNTITNCNNNNNNKTFNLQFFLNETCKNAMNLNEFVDNIDITMDDLKNTRINGLVEGISNIIIRGLNQLEIHERPIHCTDLKRDTLYIKDKEKWCKDENNEIFKETIEEIIEKEQNALNMWTDAHPDWDKITHLQDEYVLMVNRLYQPVMEDEKKEKKIIHNISKEVYIQK